MVVQTSALLTRFSLITFQDFNLCGVLGCVRKTIGKDSLLTVPVEENEAAIRATFFEDFAQMHVFVVKFSTLPELVKILVRHDVYGCVLLT